MSSDISYSMKNAQGSIPTANEGQFTFPAGSLIGIDWSQTGEQSFTVTFSYTVGQPGGDAPPGIEGQLVSGN